MGAALACLSANLCECAACMACSCVSNLVSASLGQVARFGHLMLFVGVFALSSILGSSYQSNLVGTDSYSYMGVVSIPKSLNLNNLLEGCDSSHGKDCVYNQLIYRASFALVLFFSVMAVLARCSDGANRGLWGIKVLALFGSFVAFWWSDNTFFSGFAEVARIMSFVWLLVQGLMVLDVAHDAHDILLIKMETENLESGGSSNLWKLLYLILFIGCLTGGIIGLSYLLATDGYTGCSNGMGFVVIGIIISVLQLVISSLEAVNGGVLTPAFMFAYATFMTWYALLSSPDPECNPSARIANSKDKKAAEGIVVAVTMALLLFCVANGTRILQIFFTSGEGVLESAYGGYGTNDDSGLDSVLNAQEGGGSGSAAGKSSPEIGFIEREGSSDSAAAARDPDSTGPAKERMFFHVIMAFASCYGAMVLSSWGRVDGAPEDAANQSFAGAESMWLKIISLWIFYLMYFKALHLAFVKRSS